MIARGETPGQCTLHLSLRPLSGSLRRSSVVATDGGHNFHTPASFFVFPINSRGFTPGCHVRPLRGRLALLVFTEERWVDAYAPEREFRLLPAEPAGSQAGGRRRGSQRSVQYRMPEARIILPQCGPSRNHTERHQCESCAREQAPRQDGAFPPDSTSLSSWPATTLPTFQPVGYAQSPPCRA